MKTITYEAYQGLAVNRAQRRELLAYSVIERGEGGFDFRILPNPSLVVDAPTGEAARGLIDLGNRFDRAGRDGAFLMDRLFGRHKPVIVAEGDSWFQFPILIKDVVDHLLDDHGYAMKCLSAAGDEARNMVFGPEGREKREYMLALRDQRKHVAAFLFSGAGNDIIGEDPQTKRSALVDILANFNGDDSDILGNINMVEFDKRLAMLRAAYEKVLSDVRADPDFRALPVLFHGYDYVFPYPASDTDPRDPTLYADYDQWLGRAFKAKFFPDHTPQHRALRRDILKYMINRLYDMLNDVAASDDHAWVVECRGAMSNLEDWADEIHGTDAGFGKVALRFRETLDMALKAKATPQV